MGAQAKRSFFNHEAAPGALLLLAACISMALANSPLAESFSALLKTPFGVEDTGLRLSMPISSWIKDLLMAVFFFFVGLELKREFVDGELSNARRAALPLAGAVGGMAAPALIYVGFNAGSSDTLAGWGIPMATDIAFALGVLSLLGTRVPPALKAFLLALAIIDDLGAILVIALFYGDGLQLWFLLGALLLFGLAIAFNRMGIKQIWPYLAVAPLLWLCMHESGVHATVAGVLLALTIPYRTPATTAMAEPPLLKLEHKLREVVLFGIMPLFALANAGVSFAGLQLSALTQPVTLGIALGLFFGKPLGIVLCAWLAALALRIPLPGSIPALIGVGWIAGIGFTMSLFIGALAFTDPFLLAETRIGVFVGSIAAALAGLGLLALSLRDKVATDSQEREVVDPFLVEDEHRKP